MKISEFGMFAFVTIESSDWSNYGRSVLNTIKSIPGRIYYPYDKSWKILYSQLHFLSSFLPPFSPEEERQGEADLQTFLSQFDMDDNAYNP
jgi:hypothetical protein